MDIPQTSPSNLKANNKKAIKHQQKQQEQEPHNQHNITRMTKSENEIPVEDTDSDRFVSSSSSEPKVEDDVEQVSDESDFDNDDLESFSPRAPPPPPMPSHHIPSPEERSSGMRELIEARRTQLRPSAERPSSSSSLPGPHPVARGSSMGEMERPRLDSLAELKNRLKVRSQKIAQTSTPRIEQLVRQYRDGFRSLEAVDSFLKDWKEIEAEVQTHIDSDASQQAQWPTDGCRKMSVVVNLAKLCNRSIEIGEGLTSSKQIIHKDRSGSMIDRIIGAFHDLSESRKVRIAHIIEYNSWFHTWNAPRVPIDLQLIRDKTASLQLNLIERIDQIIQSKLKRLNILQSSQILPSSPSLSSSSSALSLSSSSIDINFQTTDCIRLIQSYIEMYASLKDVIEDSNPIHDRASDLTHILAQLQPRSLANDESPYDSPDENVFRSPPEFHEEGEKDQGDLVLSAGSQGYSFDLKKSMSNNAKLSSVAQKIIDTIKSKGNPGLREILTDPSSEILKQMVENQWTMTQVLQARSRKSQSGPQIAVLLGLKRVLETLFEFGADPMTVDLQGNTLLHMCCSSTHSSIANRLDILDLILSQPKVDPNALSAKLLTPLHLLVSNSPSAQVFEMIRKMILHGADPSIEIAASSRSPLATIALKHLAFPFHTMDPLISSSSSPNAADVFVPFSRYLMSPSLSDLEVRVGDKKFPVHKVVLASQSQIFRSMFESGWKESESKSIELFDVSPQTFKLFLTFLYTAQCPIGFDAIRDAIELLVYAQQHLLDRLVDHCQRFLLKTLSIESAFAVFALASELRCDDLASAAGHFILCNYRELSSYDTDHAQLFKVLQRVFLKE